MAVPHEMDYYSLVNKLYTGTFSCTSLPCSSNCDSVVDSMIQLRTTAFEEILVMCIDTLQ
ncbi:hypothetical protein M404DRAFT_999895 [Pisolithus tinctorius Marx 270]|uniref:Uncharacterized protein n=1 Tax=Pisolithus tinctorius Marx 270 TaxID=870435 RepID=A0A0C3NWR6_PISTI|nr:hypothetical protein M404DRAFT_999895 [Pisolithus tinctorius Marx 270]